MFSSIKHLIQNPLPFINIKMEDIPVKQEYDSPKIKAEFDHHSSSPSHASFLRCAESIKIEIGVFSGSINVKKEEYQTPNVRPDPVAQSVVKAHKVESKKVTKKISVKKEDVTGSSSPTVSQASTAVSKPKPAKYNKNPEEGKPNSKHIIKNFGKAMVTFACSEIARTYLEKIVAKYDLKIKEFQDYIKSKRESVDSMKSIRDLLLIKPNDKVGQIASKKVFQEISIIFLKYFSVNWIFQGKMTYKQAHVNARFKMLRRVQNPEHFTYFKDFTRY